MFYDALYHYEDDAGLIWGRSPEITEYLKPMGQVAPYQLWPNGDDMHYMPQDSVIDDVAAYITSKGWKRVVLENEVLPTDWYDADAAKAAIDIYIRVFLLLKQRLPHVSFGWYARGIHQQPSAGYIDDDSHPLYQEWQVRNDLWADLHAAMDFMVCDVYVHNTDLDLYTKMVHSYISEYRRLSSKPLYIYTWHYLHSSAWDGVSGISPRAGELLTDLEWETMMTTVVAQDPDAVVLYGKWAEPGSLPGSWWDVAKAFLNKWAREKAYL